MEVTALGHTGLRVAGAVTTGLVDPWLSADGAFLGSWHQWPPNDRVVTPELLAPDWVVVSSSRCDRMDLDTLAKVPARTPVFVPAPAPPRLVELLRAGTSLDVFEVRPGMRVALGTGGDWLALLPAQSPAHPGAAVLASIDGETLFDMNDVRLTPGQARRARLALGGAVDLVTVSVASASWDPFCFEYPHEEKVALAREHQLARLQIVRRLLRAVAPGLTVPFGGPPCFLDPALAEQNEWLSTPRAVVDPVSAAAWFREQLPQLSFTTLLPGDRCAPRSRIVLPDPRGEDFSFEDPVPHLQRYALARAVNLSRLYASHPEPTASLAEAFVVHFEQLGSLNEYFLERIAMVVRFEVEGSGGGRWDVHLFPGRVHVDLRSRAVTPGYRFRVQSTWLAPVLAGRATWEDLLFSRRFSVRREHGATNDHLFWLLRHADRETLRSIEAYERSHALAGRPEIQSSAHIEPHRLPVLDDQPGVQVVAPCMR